MKLFSALMSLTWAAAYARELHVDSISSKSKLGQKILSKARRLDEENQEIDITWMTGYDLKFQGCYETNAWNADGGNGDDDQDVKIMTKRLVRFRLCPSGSCDGSSASGCTSGYGDYLVDLNQFLDTWSEAKMQKEEYECEQVRESCGCGQNDQDDDEEACEYNCYTSANMSYCIEDENKFELQRYTYCGELEMPEEEEDNGRKRKRRLDEEEEEEQLFLGPYCSGQGGSIHLGMFTDETCSVKYDSYYGRDYYYNIFGKGMPYSQSNLVGLGCKTCIAPVYDDGNNRKLDEEYMDGNGNYVAPICYESYFGSAKCEDNLSIDYPNSYGCNYIEGIKIIRAAGTVTELDATPSKSASAFIGIFAVSFVVLGAYVYYLKTKLDKAKINLEE